MWRLFYDYRFIGTYSVAPSCKILNIVSILVFIAAIWRVRSATLLPSCIGKFFDFSLADCGAPKQSLQYTGRVLLGRNGTWHALPHLLHTASNFCITSSRSRPGCAPCNRAGAPVLAPAPAPKLGRRTGRPPLDLLLGRPLYGFLNLFIE